MHSHILLALIVLVASVASAAEIEFEGTPAVKVEVAEGAAQTQAVLPQRAREFGVKVVRTGSEYAWASRKNVPLIKHESGAYVTYVAANGAGYVRVLNPAMRKALQALPQEQREKEYVYMEHIVNQLGSITYYGR